MLVTNMFLRRETKEGLMDLGVNPETVEWISVKDYLGLSEEAVGSLHEVYRTMTFYGTDNDKIFLVKKES